MVPQWTTQQATTITANQYSLRFDVRPPEQVYRCPVETKGSLSTRFSTLMRQQQGRASVRMSVDEPVSPKQKKAMTRIDLLELRLRKRKRIT